MHVLGRRTAWVFDLDGTLTEPVHDFAAIRAQLGVPDGTGILEAIEASPRDEARRLTARLDEIEFELAGRARPSAGAADLLEHLHRGGRRIGVVTRNNAVNCRRTLDTIGLRHYFDDADLVTRERRWHKPDPRGIGFLLKRWGVCAGHAVMVGNHRIDLEAGRAAGVATVLFARPGYDPAWARLADVVVQRLSDLLRPARETTGDML